MDNRRAHYRHVFPVNQRPAAQVRNPGGEVCNGGLVDLGIGGCSILIPPEIDAAVGPDPLPGTRLITFALFAVDETVDAVAELANRRTLNPPIAGFRFLQLIDPRAQAAFEKRLWRHLLDLQRQERVQRQNTTQRRAG